MRIVIGLLILLLAGAASAQPQQASVRVTGHVSAAYQIEAVSSLSSAGSGVRISQRGSDTILISVQPATGRPEKDHVVEVVLALRTNAEGFQLLASNDGAETVISLSPLAASGSGALVAPGAATSFHGLTGRRISGAEEVVASGGRVSAGGRFSSPDNALLVKLVGRIVGAQPAILTLKMASKPS